MMMLPCHAMPCHAMPCHGAMYLVKGDDDMAKWDWIALMCLLYRWRHNTCIQHTHAAHICSTCMQYVHAYCTCMAHVTSVVYLLCCYRHVTSVVYLLCCYRRVILSCRVYDVWWQTSNQKSKRLDYLTSMHASTVCIDACMHLVYACNNHISFEARLPHIDSQMDRS